MTKIFFLLCLTTVLTVFTVNCANKFSTAPQPEQAPQNEPVPWEPAEGFGFYTTRDGIPTPLDDLDDVSMYWGSLTNPPYSWDNIPANGIRVMLGSPQRLLFADPGFSSGYFVYPLLVRVGGTNHPYQSLTHLWSDSTGTAFEFEVRSGDMIWNEDSTEAIWVAFKRPQSLSSQRGSHTNWQPYDGYIRFPQAPGTTIIFITAPCEFCSEGISDSVWAVSYTWSVGGTRLDSMHVVTGYENDSGGYNMAVRLDSNGHFQPRGDTLWTTLWP